MESNEKNSKNKKQVKKLLLLGNTGKMGTAITRVFSSDYNIVGKNTQNLDATVPSELAEAIQVEKPDIVINTIALNGIDISSEKPELALELNTLLPKRLATMAHQHGFLLVHFSTEAVFADGEELHVESEAATPINMYGFTKYGGDCLISSQGGDYYLIRIPLLFGEVTQKRQFVEKMLQRVKDGNHKLKISKDIFSCPTYSKDIALELKRIIEEGLPFGLYHVANSGVASLYELMLEVFKNLKIEVDIQPVPHTEFPGKDRKNVSSLIRSEKLPPLRDWRLAVKDYCKSISQ